MAINVTHSKVSTIPDGDDTSLIRPSDWNDDHVINGLGTMAEQDANNVNITGGTISGVTIPASNLTGTVDVPHGGTGATTLTGYVKGSGTSPLTASSTIPNTDITGLGTASTKDAGVALGVATLDAGGTVPLSQIPASIIGGLNYQGTWNASTNTPTLTSSVGTKGYYYAVSVAGTTNLNGITDWNVGDLAVFDGSAWQQIDNTDAVTSVNGYTGTVVLTYTDVGAFPATTTTGTGSVVLQTSPTINTPTISGATVDGSAPYMNFTPTTAPTYVEGRVFYDSTAHTLNYYNDNSQMSVNIGQEQIIRVRNQTGSDIPNGSVVYVSGATGNTPTISLAIATAFSTSDIIGVTTTDVANNGFGYVTTNGLVNGLDTSAFADGNPVFLSATTAGALTATEPNAPNYSVQVGVIVRANPSVGTLLVATQQISTEVSHIIGTLAVSQGGTGQTSYTNGQLLIGNTTGNTLTKSTLTAGTGVSVTNGAGSITIANTGVTSAVAGTGISVSGSTGAVTVTNTAPDQTVVLTAGTGISTSGTYPNFTITNTSPSLGGTVTSVATGTGLTGGPITSSGTISLANTAVTAGSYTLANITVDAQGRITAATNGSAGAGTVTSVGGTGSVNGITLSGTVTSSGNLTLGGTLSGVSLTTQVTGTLPVGNGGTGITSLTAGYIPFGNGTSAFNSSSSLFWDNTNARLGVGTSSPGSVLDIVGSGNPTLTIRGSAGAYTSFLTLQAAGGGSSVINATGASSDALVFQITASEKMRINSSGNVGIGTASPTNAKLQVSGGAIRGSHLWDNANYYNNAYYNYDATYGGFAHGTGTSLTSFFSITSAGTVNTYVDMYNDGNTFVLKTANTERMRINSSGQVGIGTASPSALLDINSNVALIGPKAALAGSGGNWRYRDDTATTRWLTGILGSSGATDFSIYDVVNSATRLTLNSSTGAATFGSTINVTGNSGLPSSGGGGSMYWAAGYSSPVSGKLVIGDGTGWQMNFSKRSGSVTADVVTITDGGAITAIGAISAANGIYAESTAPFHLNATTVSANFTVPANYNAMSAGAITVNTGVTVTVTTGSTWTIV